MASKTALFKALQALPCTVFALMLVFWLPSVGHSHDAMHGAHVSASSHAKSDHSHNPHANLLAVEDDCSEMLMNQASSENGDKCCGEVCLTLVLTEMQLLLVSADQNCHEPIMITPLVAFAPVGFLRPPRHLV
ncbi:hypothetical protein [Antarcticimicrobium luteum]|uniref:Uncharacterized protein n=1 Tax=Antarcticimicrobium luteum TaxID=2547397 RepID=A0A4R5VEA9_9RHOB|nr:hypothetical protein [Antarcticimicrobium luteum]TDK50713.1 hypothetical protein E1832_05820 [Antarcticimicrobium luteum]